MKNLRKSFGPTQALKGVHVRIEPGEVIALIGENGAGKSTLMKILSGVHKPDNGSMHINGKNYAPRDPLDARKHGIVMIYQELTLAPDLSVAENISLGVEQKRGVFINGKKRDTLARKALDELGCDSIQPQQVVRDLSLGQQQMVEIARGMVTQAQVLILDEPTSSLTQDDTQHLFSVIKKLKKHGVSIIYISHFLEECQHAADRYVILRDGESVAEGSMKAVEHDELIAHMIGREVDDLYPRSPRNFGNTILHVQGLSGRSLPARCDFKVRAGEVFGIFGLIGSGRTESARCLFGLDPQVQGSCEFRACDFSGLSVRAHWQAGIGMVSENRKEEGLFLNLSLAENLTASAYKQYSKKGIIRATEQEQNSQPYLERMSVKCEGPQQIIRNLSGGNQQKVAIGRLLHHDCELLILDEPTRGIDVGSKARIYEIIDELAQQGKAIIVISSYIPELLGICDSIAVMCRGTLNYAKPQNEWDEQSIMAAAIGHDHNSSESRQEHQV